MAGVTGKKVGPETADYPAIRKLAEALWKQDATYHGAAIMVGSGFSRSAASSSDLTKKLPLWFDLSRLLANELEANPNSDPLRLAEEYQAYFGKQAIHDLIKSAVNDAGWSPGALHRLLLELPWTDVLTTNWDTLLERASRDVHQSAYTVVNKQEDLSGSHSPRIVKLHGTIGVTQGFTFTQEDYRKYPEQHAAFVNLARQVFIENELCLLGFSGDDPNFLQWAGWVRDQLATSARRIYLVGALELKPARRKYLESINVSPIDLTDLVKEFDDPDVRHARATEYFINALVELKPRATWDWSPAQVGRTRFEEGEIEKTQRDAAYGASLLEKQLPALQMDRESYPGWLVAPGSVRMRFDSQISDPYPTAEALGQLKAEVRPKALFEIAWRYRISYRPLGMWLARELLEICDPGIPASISKKHQLEIAELLLRNAHYGEWDDGEAKLISERVSKILLNHGQYWDEALSWLAYHQAICARDELDFPRVESLVGKIEGLDPVWRLRKASLLSELGRFEEGELMILESYQELLRQFRQNRNSVFVVSRLAWAHWLKRAAQFMKPPFANDRLPALYKEFLSDPFDLVSDIDDEADRAVQDMRRSVGFVPNFEAGSYKDNSKTVRFVGRVPLSCQMDGLALDAGVPLRWERVSMLVELALKVLTLGEADRTKRLSLIVRSASEHSDTSLDRNLSRIGIAQLELKDVFWLKVRVLAAIDWLVDSIARGIGGSQKLWSRLNVMVEVLGRICIRLCPDDGKTLFMRAMKLGENRIFQTRGSCEALGRLIENSLECISDSAECEVASCALAFPLDVEVGFGVQDRWPNPVIDTPGNRVANTAVTARISQLIEHVEKDSEGKTSALLRLVPLVKSGFLDKEELRRLGGAIWSLPIGKEGVPSTGLLRSALLSLPSPDRKKTMDLVRRSLFDGATPILINEESLTSMVRVALDAEEPVLPDAAQAVQIFDKLVLWRPKEDFGNPFAAALSNGRFFGRSIARALGEVIVPCMNSLDLTVERFEKILQFMSDTDTSSSLLAVVSFRSSDAKVVERVARLVREGLLDSRPDYVAFASHALCKWRERENHDMVLTLVSRLVHMVDTGRSPNLSALLQVCEKLLRQGLLRTEDVELLVQSIPSIFDRLCYERIDPVGREAIDASIVRAACVRLAKTLCESPRWTTRELELMLSNAKEDALPEVRFATNLRS